MDERFFHTFLPAIRWARNGFGRYEKHGGRNAYYEKKFPLGEDGNGDFIWEPIVLEKEEEAQAASKQKESKKEETARLQRIYDRFSPWDPVVLRPDQKDVQEWTKTIARLRKRKIEYKNDTGFGDLERLDFIPFRIAALIESLELKYSREQETPSTISLTNMRLAVEAVELIMDTFLHRADKHFTVYMPQSWGKKDAILEKELKDDTLSSAIKTAIRKTGETETTWRAIRGKVRSAGFTTPNRSIGKFWKFRMRATGDSGFTR